MNYIKPIFKKSKFVRKYEVKNFKSGYIIIGVTFEITYDFIKCML